jgi:thiamine kinase-like enzyme
MDAQAAIRDLELWPETPQIRAIPAGYTNENFRVLAGGEAYFARVGEDLPHHGISRSNEALCSKIAARAGIGPEVVYAREGVLVTRFIEGETLKMGETPGEATLAAIALLLGEVHRLPPLPELKEVDYVKACRGYLGLPGGNRLRAADKKRLESLLEKAHSLGSPCFVHGDAFPENFIDDGRRLWLVDWEYAGRGHPAMDLAYVAMNFQLAERGIRALVKAHGGSVSASTVQALLPVAAARDLLWCLCQIEARGLTKALESYTLLCCRRLDVEYEPRSSPA